MEHGLSIEDIAIIKKVFWAHSNIYEVILFGSRAKGNYKPGSDIDLAVVADAFTFDELLELHTELEKLGLLYRFDIQNFKKIKDPCVIDHIERVGKVFYNRGKL